jgi:hypothetical protein
MELRYSLSFADYAAALALHAKRSVLPYLFQLASYYAFPVVGLPLIALTVLTAKPGNSIQSHWITLLCGVYLLCCPLILRQAAKRRFKRSQSGDGDCATTFDENSIRVTGPHSSSVIEWKAIKSFSEDKKVFLLYLALGKFIVVPTRACSEEQINELRRILPQKTQRIP